MKRIVLLVLVLAIVSVSGLAAPDDRPAANVFHGVVDEFTALVNIRVSADSPQVLTSENSLE